MKRRSNFIGNNQIPILTLILIANLVSVGVFGLYKFTNVLVAKYDRIEQMTETQKSLENKLYLMNQTKADMNVYTKELAALDLALPEKESTEILITDLVREAAKTGHRLDNVIPYKSRNLDYLQATIKFIGDPNLVGILLENIESIPRIMEIEKIQVTETKKGDTEIKIDARVYVWEGRKVTE